MEKERTRGHLRKNIVALFAGAAMVVGLGLASATPAAAGGNCYGSYISGDADFRACNRVVSKAAQLGVSFVPNNGTQLVRWAHGYCQTYRTKGFAAAQDQARNTFGQKKAQAIGYGAVGVLC